MQVKQYVFAITLCMLLGIYSSTAQIPGRISVQGVGIKDNKALNGSFPCTMRIYDAQTGGTVVFQENKTVNFDNGLFHAYLGEFLPIMGLTFDRPYWLGIELQDGELSPRIQMTTVPYAFMAGNVPDSSLLAKKLSKRGGKPGQALVATNNNVEWQNIVNKLTATAHFILSPREADGTGTIRLSLAQGSISGEYLMDNSITPIKLGTVGTPPSDGDVLTFDETAGGQLQWSKPLGSSGSFRLPYNVNYDKPGDAFSINHLGNGRAGKFSISTPASDVPALHAESKGIGAALYAEAGGTGHAGDFKSLASSGNRSALHAEHAAGGAALEAVNTSATGNVASIRSSIVSTGDSATTYSGIVLPNNPGTYASGIYGAIRSTTTIRGTGVWGHHAGRGSGTLGSSVKGVGVMGRSTDSIGIMGIHTALTGKNPGIMGATSSKQDSAAAMIGIIRQDSAGINSSGIVGINNTKTNLGNGIWGQHLGGGNAVYGSTIQGTGIRGVSSNAVGVVGTHSATTGTGEGVRGETNSTTANAIGTSGNLSSLTPGAGATGVRGKNSGTNGNGSGVWGSHDGSGIGVQGTSNSGTGLYGRADGALPASTGVMGETTSPYGTAVKGISNGRKAIGVSGNVTGDSSVAVQGIATGTAPTSYAGYFDGKVNIKGSLTRSYGNGIAGERQATPICYGTVSANGLIMNGTPNFEAAWSNAGYYTITLNGLTYSNANFTTVVTPIGGLPVVTTANEFVGGILQIRIYNLSGNAVQNSFSFMIYRPQ